MNQQPDYEKAADILFDVLVELPVNIYYIGLLRHEIYTAAQEGYLHEATPLLTIAWQRFPSEVALEFINLSLTKITEPVFRAELLYAKASILYESGDHEYARGCVEESAVLNPTDEATELMNRLRVSEQESLHQQENNNAV